MDKRKLPRTLASTLPESHAATLLYGGAKYPVRNISEDGIGLWVSSVRALGLELPPEFNAELVIGGVAFAVSLECIHQSPKLLGLRIKDKTPELAQVFGQMLEPSSYAARLIPHPESGTADDEMGHQRLWFTGDPGTELLVWYHEFKTTILALQLVWQKKRVYREQFKDAETGLLGGNVTLGGKRISQTSYLTRHAVGDPAILAQAAQFLTSVPDPLPGALLWQFLETGEQIFLPEFVLHGRKTPLPSVG